MSRIPNLDKCPGIKQFRPRTSYVAADLTIETVSILKALPWLKRNGFIVSNPIPCHTHSGYIRFDVTTPRGRWLLPANIDNNSI